jgi:hypothetical protein
MFDALASRGTADAQLSAAIPEVEVWNMDKDKLKMHLKVVSSTISDLASSLETYVEEEKDPKAKTAFEEQIAKAHELAEALDDEIMRIIQGG